MFRVLLLTMVIGWPLGGVFFYSLTKAASRADDVIEHAQAMRQDRAKV